MASMIQNEARPGILRRQRLPAVRRVRDILRSAILVGEFRTGPLPSEQALTAQYGVSRGVIRDVLDLLRNEGLIERLQGAGTFVVTPALSGRSIDLLDSRLEGEDHTRTFRSVLTVEQVPAPAFVADRLGIADGDPVVYHERLNHLDGQPLTLRTGWMPAKVGERLVTGDADLQGPVLYVIESVLGFAIDHVDLKVEACLADAATAPVLAVELGAPLVLIERLVRDAAGTALELSYSRMRGDRLFLSTVLRREVTRETTLAS